MNFLDKMRERRANKRLFLANPLLDCIASLMPCELYAISLSNIKKTKHATPPRLLIHGGAKLGKSTFSASAPNPIFIRTEDGLNGIDTNAFDLAKSYQDVKEALIALATQPHDFKTVVVDSADWLEALIHAHICKTNGTGSMRTAEGGYGNAYNVAANIFKEVLDHLDDLNKRLGMIVIVICHSTVSELRDPEHETYDIAGLKLHKTASAKLCEWADVIGYAKRPIVVTKNNDGDYKAIDKGQNVMNELILGSSATSVSGNRYSLPQKIPLVWQAFEQAFATASSAAATQQPAVQPATQSAAQPTISN
jgi:hypothetical protein